VDKKEQSLGEQLEGHDLTNSGFQIHFMQVRKSCGGRAVKGKECCSHVCSVLFEETCAHGF